MENRFPARGLLVGAGGVPSSRSARRRNAEVANSAHTHTSPTPLRPLSTQPLQGGGVGGKGHATRVFTAPSPYVTGGRSEFLRPADIGNSETTTKLNQPTFLEFPSERLPWQPCNYWIFGKCQHLVRLRPPWEVCSSATSREAGSAPPPPPPTVPCTKLESLRLLVQF